MTRRLSPLRPSTLPAQSSLATHQCRKPRRLRPGASQPSQGFRYRIPHQARARRPSGARSQRAFRERRDSVHVSAARRAGRNSPPSEECDLLWLWPSKAMSSYPVVSVDLNGTVVKNRHARDVRKRTSGPSRPETRDRRVRKTKTSLRNALIGLAREKPYASIAVKEILDRANVGRS